MPAGLENNLITSVILLLAWFGVGWETSSQQKQTFSSSTFWQNFWYYLSKELWKHTVFNIIIFDLWIFLCFWLWIIDHICLETISGYHFYDSYLEKKFLIYITILTQINPCDKPSLWWLAQNQEQEYQQNIWNLFKINANNFINIVLSKMLLVLDEFHTLWYCFYN